MRILLISALEVWALAGQGGAPSLFKTLEGYGRRGHQVDVVTPTLGANHHHGAPIEPPPQIEGVSFHTFHLPSVAESRLGTMPRLSSRGMSNGAPRPEGRGMRGVADLIAKADQKLRFALLFPPLAGRNAMDLIDANPPYDLLYGYEVHGVLAQRFVRFHRKLPLVARFQGTVMHPYLEKPLSLARKYEEVLALRTPADLYVMTDDGTQGDEVLSRLNPASKGKVRFWRNGLELGLIRAPTDEEAKEARASLSLADEELVLVTAARLARWKRIDRGIDAVALLRQRGVPARLLVVGDGEERANLEAQAAALGLRDAVCFVGAVAQSEVQRYLWAADVFLSLNELSNVGNPLLEAMQAGRCLVTLDEGDTKDLIVNNETGVLLPASGEPSTIADALSALASDPQYRQRLANAAQAYAKDHFWSWQQRIDAEVDAVEALVANRSTAATHG